MATVHPAKNCCGQSAYWHTSDQAPPSHFLTCRPERYSAITHKVREIFLSVLSIWSTQINENGMVTAVALLLMAVLALLGTAAVVVTSTDILIGGNYKASEQAFYSAEAGAEEARARLRSTAGANQINDNGYENSTEWRTYIYIGTLDMAQKAGERCLGCVAYDSSKAMHFKKVSLNLQPEMTYVVEIKHKTDTADPTKVMYWGDDNGDGTVTRNTISGKNIYLVNSSGYSGNSFRTVEAEITKVAPIPVPGPLYIESAATIQGTSTYISGMDACGNDNKHGLVTTQPTDSVTIPGNSTPIIAGVDDPNGDPPGDIYQIGYSLDIPSKVNSFKDLANFSYNGSNPSIPNTTDWGNPEAGATKHDPSTCDVQNIVYFNTSGGTIQLGGQPPGGCGILLVEGNLRVDGNFAWNGIILVTGTITYAGGGNKQVTGGILAGGTVDADLVGGNASIVYCSSAVKKQTESLPLRSLSWKDLRAGN